ncbi:hypothetical protein CDL12_15743 [Handroanthus impetiginosus]|uniref:Uncharacterized protein n=1 Tax=Handroanthus impetiginosus TaxID=429701 RepID=A0A2G9H2D3_9LAMI|nr:hypothetical protein CDL12_15743 [Handroanthus impetiginosus]
MATNRHMLEPIQVGSNVPEEAYVVSDSGTFAVGVATANSRGKELEIIMKRLQEIKEEVGALREMKVKLKEDKAANLGFLYNLLKAYVFVMMLLCVLAYFYRSDSV